MLAALWKWFNRFAHLVKLQRQSSWQFMELLRQNLIAWRISLILISKLLILNVIWNMNRSGQSLELISHNWRLIFWQRCLQSLCKLLRILKRKKVKHDRTARQDFTLEYLVHKSLQQVGSLSPKLLLHLLQLLLHRTRGHKNMGKLSCKIVS